MSNPNLNFTHSRCRLRPVRKVQFGIFSPVDIKRGSVLQKKRVGDEELRSGVTKVERYRNGVPVYGGLSDPRMGTNRYYYR